MSNTRVPETIAAFNTYITSTTEYLAAGSPSNLTRLGLSTANGDDWSAFNTKWIALYAKYADPVQSTAIIKSKVRDFMRAFAKLVRPLLNVIAASPNATNDDAAVFNLILDSARKKPTHASTPITDTVMAEVKTLGSGDVFVRCRSIHDAKRASKHAHADTVQVAYKIGGDAPANANDGTSKEIYTRARFIMHLEMENQGKKVYLMMRWYNTRHHELAGPWGQLITISLS